MADWSWTRFEDEKPEQGEHVYVSFGKKVWISKFFEGHAEKDLYWCRINIPEPPKIYKLKPCKELKGLSNDYILALEKRVEKLERHIDEIRVVSDPFTDQG